MFRADWLCAAATARVMLQKCCSYLWYFRVLSSEGTNVKKTGCYDISLLYKAP